MTLDWRRHQVRLRIKTMGVFTAVLGCWPGLVLAQTTDEPVEDARTTDDVITQSMGPARESSVAGASIPSIVTR